MYQNGYYPPNYEDNQPFQEDQRESRGNPYQSPYSRDHESANNSFEIKRDTQNPYYESPQSYKLPFYEESHQSFHNSPRSLSFNQEYQEQQRQHPLKIFQNYSDNNNRSAHNEENQFLQHEDHHQINQYPPYYEDNQHEIQYPQNEFQSPSYDLPFARDQRNNFRDTYQNNPYHSEPRPFGFTTDIRNPYHESQLASQRSQNQEPQGSRRYSSEATGYFTNPPQLSHRSPRNSKREFDGSLYDPPAVEAEITPPLHLDVSGKLSLEAIRNFQPEANTSFAVSPSFIHHLRVHSQDQFGQPNTLTPNSLTLDLNTLNFGQAQNLQEKNILMMTDHNDAHTLTFRNQPVATETALKSTSPLPEAVNRSLSPSPREPVKSAETSPKPKSIPKICFLLTFIYIISALGATIALMVYHFDKNKTDFTPISGALEYMSFNLNAAPIMELELVNQGSSCSAGLTSIPIGTWSGTVWGCNCPSALKRGVCSYSESKSCSLVFPYAERKLGDWRESIWCGRRAEIGTELVKKKTCPTGYMQCSPGICVINTGSCPITSLSVSSAVSSNLFGDSSGKYLTITSTVGEDPLIDITISSNSIPCFSNGYYNTGDTETYILLRDREKGCSKYGLDSEHSIKLDEKIQYDVLSTDNSFSATLFSLLVGYQETTENTNAVLSSRKRISVTNSDSCLTLDSEKFQTPISSYKNLRKILTSTSIIAISLLGALTLVLLGLGIHLRRSMRKLSFIEALNQKSIKGVLFFASIFALFGVAIYTVMFILVTIHRSGMMETYEDYKTLQNDCFTGKSAEVLQDYQNFVDTVIKTIYNLALALLVIAWTTVTPALILLYKHLFFNSSA